MKRFIALILCLTPIAGCTNNSNQEAETLARKERELERIIRDSEKAEAAKQQEATPEPTEPEEPAAPPEPQYEEVEYVKYDGTECKERELESCGMVFSDCANGMVYRCMMNVKYSIITKKVLVE